MKLETHTLNKDGYLMSKKTGYKLTYTNNTQAQKAKQKAHEVFGLDFQVVQPALSRVFLVKTNQYEL